MAEPTPEQASSRIEVLLDELASSSDPDVPGRVAELVQCVLALHSAGLSRIVAGLDWDVLRDLATDDTVASVLLLHDLHPVPLPARAESAIETLRAGLGHAGDGVRLVGVDAEGVAHVELGPGCQAAADGLAESLRQALLDAVPDLAEVTFAQAPAGPALLQLSPTRVRDTEART